MKTTIRTTVPFLANLLLALQLRRQPPALRPHRISHEAPKGHVRFNAEAPIEVRSIWQREAYQR